MKRLIFLTIMLLFTNIALQATELENKEKLYSVVIDVEAQKTNGKNWDIFGGSPDIKIVINGQSYFSPTKCKDRYRCSIEFSSTKNKWYIEVYDKDMKNDDLIGKGDCKVGKNCNLGLAKVKITEISNNK